MIDVPNISASDGNEPRAEEWFTRPDNDTGEAGLSFTCTQCGNCCTGEGGYVRFTQAEATTLAARLRVSHEQFIARYTHETQAGRSLKEKTSASGLDCIFLDRDTFPGRAICGVYEDRPMQCRTWPFWKSNLSAAWSWARAARSCPGMNKGTRYSLQQIRVLRDKVEI